MSNNSNESKTGKRILVTGGAGYIGSHTCVELLKAGFEVVVLDNLDNSSLESLRRVEELTGKSVPFHLVDLCNYDAVELIFAKSAPFDGVIHFAGLKAVGESASIPLRYYHNNITGTLNLLRAMEKHNCFSIVFSSSATVYGGAIPPISEDVPTPSVTTNPYGTTKLHLEHILQDIARGTTGPQWKIVILRYFNPIGAHESGRIGEDPQGIPNNLMPYVTQVAVGRRAQLSIFGDDYDTVDGTGVRDYIHVVDLAIGHVAAIQEGILAGKMEGNCDIFNLGTGTGYSVLQMVEAMKKASGKPIPYVVGPRRAGDVGANFADASKANRVLGWKAERSLEKSCEDMWRWQSQNPYGFKLAPQ